MTTDKADEIVSRQDPAATWQGRQQVRATLLLCAVIAVATATYTWVTWKSVAATREANEIQRQLLELQQARPGSKSASARRQDTRAVTQTSRDSQRGGERARPSARQSGTARREATDGHTAPAAESNGLRSPSTWTTRSASAERYGRQ
jgi:hypothetical protein